MREPSEPVSAARSMPLERRDLRVEPGRRLISIIGFAAGSGRRTESEADGKHQHRCDFVSDERFESPVTYLQCCKRVSQRYRNPQALSERLGEPRHARTATAQEHRTQSITSACALCQVCSSALHTHRDLLSASGDYRVQLFGTIEAAEH